MTKKTRSQKLGSLDRDHLMCGLARGVPIDFLIVFLTKKTVDVWTTSTTTVKSETRVKFM
jgi:hypothetical protein